MASVPRLPQYWFALMAGAAVGGKLHGNPLPMASTLRTIGTDWLNFTLSQHSGLSGGGRVYDAITFTRPRKKTDV